MRIQHEYRAPRTSLSGRVVGPHVIGQVTDGARITFWHLATNGGPLGLEEQGMTGRRWRDGASGFVGGNLG